MGAGLVTRDLADIYDNVLVAIDPERGINNGPRQQHEQPNQQQQRIS